MSFGSVSCYKLLIRRFATATVTAVLLLTVSVQVAATLNDTAMTMPGRLVDTDSHRLYLHCSGPSTAVGPAPTVVLEARLGGTSLEWVRVQQELSQSLRVCSYDRAGMGWSDSGQGSRASAEVAGELYRLLDE